MGDGDGRLALDEAAAEQVGPGGVGLRQPLQAAGEHVTDGRGRVARLAAPLRPYQVQACEARQRGQVVVVAVGAQGVLEQFDERLVGSGVPGRHGWSALGLSGAG